MKLLFLFCPGVSAHKLHHVNPKGVKKITSLDKWFERLGGTLFTNAFTPAPDRARSLACLLTGLYPERNGCRKPGQYPAFFLETQQHIFRLLAQNGYTTHVFMHSQLPGQHGNYPEDAFREALVYRDLKTALQEIKNCNARRQASYVVMEDYNYSHLQYAKYQANIKGQQQLSEAWRMLFEALPANSFDHIFIVSDGGNSSTENAVSGSYDSLHDNRTKTLLFWHKRGTNILKKEPMPVAILDVYPTLSELLNDGNEAHTDGVSLFKPRPDRCIVMEAPLYMPDPGNPLFTVNGIWGLRTKDHFFVHRLNPFFRLHQQRFFRFWKLEENTRKSLKKPPEALLNEFKEKIAAVSSFYSQARIIGMQRERHKQVRDVLPPVNSYFNKKGEQIAYTDGAPFEIKYPALLKTRIANSLFRYLYGLTIRLRMLWGYVALR